MRLQQYRQNWTAQFEKHYYNCFNAIWGAPHPEFALLHMSLFREKLRVPVKHSERSLKATDGSFARFAEHATH